MHLSYTYGTETDEWTTEAVCDDLASVGIFEHVR